MTVSINAASGLGFIRRAARPGAPLKARLLLLHGVGGNESNLLPLAEQVDTRVEVLCVRGPLSLGGGRHAWFQVDFSGQGPRIDEAQAEQSRRQLLQLIEDLHEQDHGREVPLVVAGFSQGGIMSASVGLTRPDVLEGFAVLSGRILPELEALLAPRSALQRIQAFIAHGRYDQTLPLAWGERSDEWLARLGVPHLTAFYPIGHELNDQVIADFNQWLAEPLSL